MTLPPRLIAPAAFAAAAVLAVLAQQAAAQCPSNNICQARFDNLPGGPVDCCKWDYTKGKCFWGSWREQKDSQKMIEPS